MDILRFCVLGNIDDGKSTLIGRLLYDTGSLKKDQVEYLARHKENNALENLDFSILTDGLFDERLQKITIDVAYRYFYTEKRKFIIVDTPGHGEFVRNMVTGASQCDLCLIMLDATKGVQEQTKRHSLIASLLGIKKAIFCINKMDLVDYDEESFSSLSQEIDKVAQSLNFDSYFSIPLSAVYGENFTKSSAKMPWFKGDTLVSMLENTPANDHSGPEQMRLPVQFSDNGMCYGNLEAGTIEPGEEIFVLPDNEAVQIGKIFQAGVEIFGTVTPAPLALEIVSDKKVERGNMLVKKVELPKVSKNLRANMIWLSNESGETDKLYKLMHTTRLVNAKISSAKYEWKVNELDKAENSQGDLKTNGIYEVEILCELPIFYDLYADSRVTGAFILCNEITNNTIAAGMII